MFASRLIMVSLVGALGVATAIAMPAAGAPDTAHRVAGPSSQIFFTPASADPRLAAMVARSGLGGAPFRFTPADSRGERQVAAIAMPASPVRSGEVSLRSQPALPPVGIAPITYSLGSPIAKRLVMPDVKVDLGSSPSGRRVIDVATAMLSGRRSKLRANTEPVREDSRLVSDPTHMIDVGGSYSLSRNLDVTAGVRYKSQDRDRLAQLPDDHRDSQAVYVGTAFRF